MSPTSVRLGERVAGSEAGRLEVDRFTVTEACYWAGQTLPWHAHAAADVSIVLEGGCIESYRHTGVRMERLDVVFRPAYLIHRNEYLATGARMLVVQIDARWLADHLIEPLAGQSSRLSGAEAAGTALRLHREFRQPDRVTPLAVEGILLELLAKMVGRGAEPESPPNPSGVARAAEYLRAQVSSSVDGPVLAAMVGLPLPVLTRQFRRRYGCGLATYARRARIERAIAMLAASDATVAQVATACGFHDDSHLHRVFRDWVGVAPGAFRGGWSRGLPPAVR